MRRHSSPGQQDRWAEVLDETQGVHIVVLPTYAPVDADGLGAVSGPERTDALAPVHRLSGFQITLDRFEAALQSMTMVDGDDRAVHDGAAEADDAVGGGEDGGPNAF